MLWTVEKLKPGADGQKKLIIIVADQVKLRNSLRFHNRKAEGKAGMPFPWNDFRLRLLFGYRNSPDYDDKFNDLVSAQNEPLIKKITTFDKLLPLSSVTNCLKFWTP